MSKEKKSPNTDINQSVKRSLLILEHMSVQGSPESVPEISRKLSINKVTTYKLMRTLEEMNYVIRDDSGRYSMTSRMFEFGTKYGNSNPLTHLFNQNANLLLRTIPATEIFLAIISDSYRGVYLASTSHTDPYIGGGTAFPLYATAVGKVLLAFSSNEFQKNFMLYYSEKQRTKYTDKTVIDLEQFKKQLKQIKEDGYAVNEGEYIMNTYFFAAPVFNARGNGIAAVSIGAPRDVFLNSSDELRENVLSLAARLSTSMGYIPKDHY